MIHNLVVLAADGSEVASALVGTRVTVDVPIERSGRLDVSRCLPMAAVRQWQAMSAS